MLFTSTALLNQHVGKNNIFSSSQKLTFTLHYISGIRELETDTISLQATRFGILTHPKGLEFTCKGNERLIGLRYDEIKHYKIYITADENYQLEFALNLSKKVIFSFSKEDRKQVIPFLRELKINFLREERDESEIRDSIGVLIEEFRTKSGDRQLLVPLLDTSLYSNVKELEINDKTIRWGDKVLEVANTRGFCAEIVLNKSHGIVLTRSYEIIFNIRKGAPFLIRYTELAAKSKHRDDEAFFEYLIDVLFNVLVVDEVILWLEKLKNNEIIEFQEYNISREGLELKLGRRKRKLIYWDELYLNDRTKIRWRYTNDVWIPIESMYDRRSIMFIGFLNWMKQDEKRVEALIGSLPI